MKTKRAFISLVLAVATILGIPPGKLRAAPSVFTINNSLSQITLSGKVAGFTMSPQAAGSLVTSFGGYINMSAAGSNIQFTGSSAISAKTNGVWEPAAGGGSGSAPADYGGEISVPFVGTGYAALRNLVLDLTSPVLTVTNGSFISSALLFSFSTNSTSTLDYNAGVAGSGSESLAGLSTNMIVNGATLTNNGTDQTLTIQISTQFTFSLLTAGDTILDLNGQIVATNSPGAPVISSIVVSNQNAVLTVQNASGQSQLQSSTNLTTWTATSANVTTNAGLIVFTVPINPGDKFFRVQQ
jgi:hypothetical protein